MRAVLLLLAAASLPAAALEYPKAHRGDVVDDYFGTRVADPYRWLEDVDARDTRKWVKAQNALSLPYLAALPEREPIRARLQDLWNYERRSAPVKWGKRYFYTRNDGLQNQPALYAQDSLAGPARLLLDPNARAADGTVALADFQPSPEGRWVAAALATAGSDWNQVQVLDAASGAAQPETLTGLKFSRLSWTRDGLGFFYSRYPGQDPKNGFAALADQSLWYHRIGTAQSADVLVYERRDQPQWGFEATVTDDGRFLLIWVWRDSGDQKALYFKYLGNDPRHPDLGRAVTPLVEDFGHSYAYVGSQASVLYLLTDDGAPKKRVVAIDLRAPERAGWQTLIPEGPDVIDTALCAGRSIVTVTLHNAAHQILRYDLDGQRLGALKLPGLGALAQVQGETQISGHANDGELFYAYASFNRPASVYRCDMKSGACGPWFAPKLAFDPAQYVTEQVFVSARDGARIPMFLSHKKGLKKGPPRPTLLYGYGGFEISLLPAFSVPDLVWMERGGVYAHVNLRGGGDYGRAWHEAGIKDRKQNVFDDFIAAAEYLRKNGITDSAHLAIEGRSNGGLLIGAVLNQRPDLFAAALPAVGVMDMLRFQKFTIGWSWVSDYGSSDDAAGFKTLAAYSPYHNVKPGTRYPAVLVTTADHDDRVMPGHSFKYAAALQAAQAGDAPVLIRIDTDAGHGMGKPVSKQIEEAADKLAFISHFAGAGAP